MRYYFFVLAAGFVLDLLLGDPEKLWHPVQGIGWLISKLEKVLYPADKNPDVANGDGEGTSAFAEAESLEDVYLQRRYQKKCFRLGILLVILVLLITVAAVTAILAIAWWIHPYLWCAVATITTWQILAMKSLKVESMRVKKALDTGDLTASRKAVSRIVGRDTEVLDMAGVTKAAVETVAENLSDGVIAPMLCLALGGPIFGFFYKAVNTMDSMIGYKNDRYLYFGRAAAKLDDVMNFIPSRLSGLILCAVAGLMGISYDGQNALRIFRRDRLKHASPNSAQTESAMAGALHLRLAGDAQYFGKIVRKPFIGDNDRPIEPEDITRANRLMYAAGTFSLVCCEVLTALLYGVPGIFRGFFFLR